MKENYDNFGPIIYFFNGQDAGNNLYIFLTDMKTLISFHFVSSSNIGQILNKVDFFTVLPFFNSIILLPSVYLKSNLFRLALRLSTDNWLDPQVI